MKILLRHLIPVIAAGALLMGACSDDDTTTSTGDQNQPTTTTSTPANPNGTYLIVRYQTDQESPTPLAEGGTYTPGFAMARLWQLTPTCDGEELCDLTLSGGREDGEYSLDGFEGTEPPPDMEMTESAGVWTSTETVPDYSACILADGSYSDGLLLDATITDQLRPDGSTDRLVGTRTEEYVLNAAGEAAGICEGIAPGETLTLHYDAVAVPEEDTGLGDDEITFEGDYAATLDVVEETGSVDLEPGTTFIQAPEYWDEFAGSCGSDACSAALHREYPDNPDEPIDIDLEARDGLLVGEATTRGACFERSDGEGPPPLLTEDGYETTTAIEIRPVLVEDGVVRISVTRFRQSLEPTASAAEEFPEACRTPETNDYWFYQVSTDLTGG